MLTKNITKLSFATLVIAYTLSFAPSTNAAIINGTFEADDASAGDVAGATGWASFESVFTNSTLGPASGPVSHDAGGTQSLTMFGPFFFDGASGAYQADDSVEPGQLYTATVHAMNWVGDPLAPGNLGIFQLSFWDAAGGRDGGGNTLGVTEILVDSTDDGINVYLPPQDGADISDWTEFSITEFAPAGTVSAELFLLHIQLNDPPVGGKIFWDDVSLAPIPVPAAAWLFGSGLIGLTGIARRKKA
jgi:hypothetical protein